MATILEPNASSAEESTLLGQTCHKDFWRDSAPAKIVSDKQWQVWSKHLAKQRGSRSLTSLFESKTSPAGLGL